MARFPAILVASLLVVVVGGCGSNARGPYASDGERKRDPRAAEARYRKAMSEVDGDPAAGERLLREALGLDLYHGQAHNNLGVLLLGQDRLYDAAEEFEWARKLLPGDPEPRCNLAVTLERAGKPAEALNAARAALEVAPGHLRSIQTIALIQMRDDLHDDQTAGHLDAIIVRGDERWSTWAREQRERLASKSGPQP